MLAQKYPLSVSLLFAAALLSAGTCQATMAPDLWEILESAQPVYAEDNGELIGYDVQLAVRNLSLNGAITAFAVGVSDVNVWAYTTREGWQPWSEQGVHHAETWDYEYKQYFGGLSWDDFIGGQTRADGSNYDWFAIYFNETGNGIAVGDGRQPVLLPHQCLSRVSGHHRCNRQQRPGGRHCRPDNLGPRTRKLGLAPGGTWHRPHRHGLSRKTVDKL